MHSSFHLQCPGAGTIIPTLQEGKLRLREIRQGIQRHTISKWLIEGSSAGLIHGTWIQGIILVLREGIGCPRVLRLSAQDPCPLEEGFMVSHPAHDIL